MTTIRTIIIDDERLARDEIRRYLQAYPHFEIAGEAADAEEARELITAIRPGIIFLDIQLPGQSGFELLESLDHVPDVIFTTAFDQYAAKAFDLDAVDYLVKPIREERFSKAIDKIQSRLADYDSKESTSFATRFFIKEGNRFHFVQTIDIYLIESAGNYARLHYSGGKVYLKRSLNQLEKVLDPSHFFRANRTTIINTTHIKEVLPLPKGKLTIHLQTGDQVTVSERQTAVFKSKNKLPGNI